MLWSLIKIFIFIAIAAGLAFGVAWILETPGEVVIAFAGREWSLTPIGSLIALVVLLVAAVVILKVLGFIIALMRFLLGDETAISRYFNRSRERRGFNALSDGMIALASGDSKRAMKKAAKAEKLLGRKDVTGLVSAQAAELNGDKTRAIGYYKTMLDDSRTRFVGVSGLMRQKLEEVGAGELVQTVYGQGYRFVPLDAPSETTSAGYEQAERALDRMATAEQERDELDIGERGRPKYEQALPGSLEGL